MTTAQAKLAALPLRSWAVRFVNDDHEEIINARSRGQAKMEFLRYVEEDPEDAYLAVRVRTDGPVRPPQTTPAFRHVAEGRGVSFAACGMRVCVGEDYGVIVGHNSSANFDIRFDLDSQYPDMVLNCHPNWEIAYFDDVGEIIKDFRKGQKP
jgi:hypothetical protein